MNDLVHHDCFRALHRLRLVAGQSLSEALRLRLTGLFGAVAATGLVGSYWLRELNFGATEVAFLGDVGLGVIGIIGTVLAVLLSAHLLLNDPAAGVLVRPLRRWEFVTGKLIGAAGALALFTATLGALLASLLAWRSHQLGVPMAAVSVFLGACALQWMKFTLVAAMTVCVSTYAGSLVFATSAGLWLVVIGHLRPFATGALEWLRIWPNLALFDATGLLAGGQPLSGINLLNLAGYWAFSCGWLMVVASHVFRHREF